MKKTFTILIAAAFTLMFSVGMAQTGSTCADPHVISSLPFSQTNLTTQTTGDNYDSINGIPQNNMSGYDYVFKYTPSSNETISITLSNTNATPVIGGVGLYILSGCPDNIVSVCIDSATANNNPSIPSVSLLMGVDYYIVVSSIAPMVGNAYINFDIDVDVAGTTNTFDVGIIDISGVHSGCNLGVDSISATVVNFGTLPVSLFNIAYKVNNGTEQTQNIALLNAGDTTTITFSTPYDFSSTGSYTIVCYSKLITDEDNSNDTTTKTINNTLPISSYPYTELFESNNGGWSADGTASSWQWGVATSTLINDSATNNHSWKTNLTGNHNTSEDSYLTSPCFDFTSLVAPNLQFKIWYEGQAMIGSNTALEYSTDNGTTWTVLGTMGEANWYNSINGFSGSSQGWIGAKHSISSLAGESTVIFRFHFTAGFLGQDEGVAIDKFEIIESSSLDLGIFSIDAPMSSCGLTSSETVKVKIINYGVQAQSDFPVAFQINGGSVVSETANITVDAGDTVAYTFIATADLSNPGTHSISIFTQLSGDTDNSNDTAYTTVTNVPLVNTFPYLQNFESGDGGYHPEGTSSSWALGLPAGTIINSAASGSNSWVTNLTGNHNVNENSWVISPCFDLSSLTLPMLEIKVWYVAPTLAAGLVEYSTDGGSTWVTITQGSRSNNWYTTGGFTTGWTGTSSSWVAAYTTLDSLVGANSVIFRVHYNNQLGLFGENEGLAFDDIKIMETPPNDLGVISILEPNSGCGLGNAEALTVKIKNFATQAQTDFTVGYSLNGNIVTEIAGVTIQPGDTVEYTYTNTLNLSTSGVYQIKAFTALPTDLMNINDTFSVSVTATPEISTFPYTNNLESGNGYWTPGGTGSSWEHGVPAGTIINTAASGSNVWATNLDGNYATSENSWLQSPCLDFTSLATPMIQIKLWTEIGSLLNSGYLRLESSVDGGNTWKTVGVQGDVTNWYTGANGWDGTTGGWIDASHTLDSLGGQPSVLLRFLFNGGGFLSAASEGVAIDDIVIRDICATPSSNFSFSINANIVTFTNLSSNATSYFWDFGDGATSTQTNPSHTFSTAGSFNVKLVSTNACGQDSIIKVVSITGIEEVSFASGISVYPVPANDVLNINIDNAVSSELFIEIQNLLGQHIYTNQYRSDSKNFNILIPVASFEAGVYNLKLTGNGISKYFKVVVR